MYVLAVHQTRVASPPGEMPSEGLPSSSASDDAWSTRLMLHPHLRRGDLDLRPVRTRIRPDLLRHGHQFICGGGSRLAPQAG